MILRYILAWLPMVVLAILNGTLRELTYGKSMPEFYALQLSSVTLIVVFAIYVWLLSARWPLQTLRQSVAIGLLWLVLTVLFETGMGRFVAGESREQLLQAYNILAGSLWPLVLVFVAILPGLAFRLREFRSS